MTTLEKTCGEGGTPSGSQRAYGTVEREDAADIRSAVGNSLTILSRYIIREIVKYLCAILVCIMVIYLVADIVNKVDDLPETDIAVYKIIFCFIAQTPLEQFLPASTLLSVLVVFGLMGKHCEILALKSSGISQWRLVKPVMGVGVAISIILFVAAEFVFPVVRAKANRIWHNEVQMGQIARERDNIWIKDGNLIYHFNRYDPDRQILFGIAVSELNSRFQLVRRLDAKQGGYNGREWILKGVMEQRMMSGGGFADVTLFDELKMSLGLSPEDLKSVAKSGDEMGLWELAGYISKVESEGYDATSHRVDFHSKLAFPFLGVMLCLLGSGIALIGGRAPNLPMLVLSGIGVAFGYWVLRSFCISLAYGSMLSPFLGAWIPNLVFVVVGGYLLLSGS
ncbi:MAG: LPS export ABC transporter permease LptG [Desulfobacterales bacterium]